MTQQCGNCKFWDADTKPPDIGRPYGTCHRHAPRPLSHVECSIATGIALLAWWYIREKSDEKTADDQLRGFGLSTELSRDDFFPDWPRTEDADLCGEWQG